MATAIVKKQGGGADREVELRRQQAIVHLLGQSVLSGQAIVDTVREYLTQKVITTDVDAEVVAMLKEKGLTFGDQADAALASSVNVAALSTPRFDQEFEKQEFLGRGGFGEVWRVRSRVDQKEYAVKMVAYQFNEAEGPFEHPALREAVHWASFNEPGAVRYHSSWIEVEGPADTKTRALTAPDHLSVPGCEPVTARSAWSYQGANDVNNSDIIFADGTSTTAESPNKECIVDSPRRRPSSPAIFAGVPGVKRRATLFLQTELVRGGTLRDWIDRRNAALTASGVPLAPELSVEAAEDIFRQCVDAVSGLHAQGLVHRDIKPSNILLTEARGVRLGDFGLATKDARARIESASSMTHDSSTEMDDGEHTSGVGTKIYASPEQINGSTYDHKVDIFALGMILAELLYPVRTQMERAKIFDQLRLGEVPVDSEPIHAEAIQLLLEMLHEDPTKRPSAEEISKMLHQRAECAKCDDEGHTKAADVAGVAGLLVPMKPTPSEELKNDSDRRVDWDLIMESYQERVRATTCGEEEDCTSRSSCREGQQLHTRAQKVPVM